MLKISDIQENMARQGAISVYQLAILDFLNQAKTPEDIAGKEPQRGPLEDDPGRKSTRKGYDIGITVAERILAHRASFPGNQFTDIVQLADIPYFGIDKFNDLIYTFVALRAPVPTGLGQEFDDFIKALSALEVNALRRKIPPAHTISAVRKIFFDDKVPSLRGGDDNHFDWNKIIPAAEKVQSPADWGINMGLINAVNYITRNPNIRIGGKWVNMHWLIAGLDAKNRPAVVDTGHGETEIKSNLELATYLLGVGNSAYQYLKVFDIGPQDRFEIKQPELADSYNKFAPAAVLTAFADVYAMPYQKERSLSWNLLTYYTDQEGPVKSRFQHFARTLNLGELTDGIFTKDTVEFRQALVHKIQSATFFELSQNNRDAFVRRMLNDPDKDSAALTYRVATAYVSDLFLDNLYLQVSMEISRPAILSWNRLEARPRTQDFSRVLRAEVRDALWFLSRQWQMGEFKGEDTGSSVEMRVDMETTLINKFSLKGGNAQSYDGTVPMETIVEREPIQLDFTMRQEMGRHFERLLQAKLSAAPGSIAQSVIDGIRADFRNTPAFQFSLPTPAEFYPEIHSNTALLKIYACLSEGRALDGGNLYRSIKHGTPASSYATSTGDAAALSRVDDAAADLLVWFERVYSQPASATESAWNPSQLEYQFHCSAPAGLHASTVLTTTEYANGHLDWYNFDFETAADEYNGTLTSGMPDANLINRRLISVLPADLIFPGMPASRWWQFEDYKIDIGDIKANTNEVPKLLLAEFALIYSNDWMLLPFNVQVGNLCNIRNLVVKDVFGQYIQVNAAGAGDDTDWQRWSMFNLKRRNMLSGRADNRLFVPPAVIRTMESEPIEKVNLLRDEMANMVWGIETSIPDGLGSHEDGWDAARRLYDYLIKITPSPGTQPPVNNDAQIRYQIGTTVPEHWIPFIPVRLGGVNSRQIQLRRAAMPRLIPGRTPERIRPRTELLRTGYDPSAQTWGPYFLHEEEVPRSGVQVTRSWQRTRWLQGAVFTWLGRQVKNGRGEANSGLEFDSVQEKEVL